MVYPVADPVGLVDKKKVSFFYPEIKGVQESESRTGTWLVSPGRRPEKKKSDLSVYSSWNTILKAKMSTKLSQMLYKAVGNEQKSFSSSTPIIIKIQ